MLHSNIQV